MRILISLAAGAALCSALAPNVLVNQQEHAALYGAHNKADYTGKEGFPTLLYLFVGNTNNIIFDIYGGDFGARNDKTAARLYDV